MLNYLWNLTKALKTVATKVLGVENTFTPCTKYVKSSQKIFYRPISMINSGVRLWHLPWKLKEELRAVKFLNVYKFLIEKIKFHNIRSNFQWTESGFFMYCSRFFFFPFIFSLLFLSIKTNLHNIDGFQKY